MLRRRALQLLALLMAPASQAFANPMNDEVFWSIIASAKGAGGSQAHSERLVSALMQLSASDIVDFYIQYERHFDLADRGDVWAAGLLLNGGHLSDDGFEYFRSWLIGQGRTVYEAALANPDSLADVTIELIAKRPSAEWESFGYAPSDAFASKTNADLYEAAASRLPKVAPSAQPSFESQEYTDKVMLEKLPRLWKRWGRFKVELDRRVKLEFQRLFR